MKGDWEGVPNGVFTQALPSNARPNLTQNGKFDKLPF